MLLYKNYLYSELRWSLKLRCETGDLGARSVPRSGNRIPHAVLTRCRASTDATREAGLYVLRLENVTSSLDNAISVHKVRGCVMGNASFHGQCLFVLSLRTHARLPECKRFGRGTADRAGLVVDGHRLDLLNKYVILFK